MAVLDTTFLIELERGGPIQNVLQEIEDLAPPLRLPAVVWVEYLSGLAPSPRGTASRRLEGRCVFEPFDRTIADLAARLQYDLLRAGTPLAWTDLQVAATALHYNEPLFSNDEVYAHVPGLEWHRH